MRWGRSTGSGADLSIRNANFGRVDGRRTNDVGDILWADFDFWAVDVGFACWWWAGLRTSDLRNEATGDRNRIRVAGT